MRFSSALIATSISQLKKNLLIILLPINTLTSLLLLVISIELSRVILNAKLVTPFSEWRNLTFITWKRRRINTVASTVALLLQHQVLEELMYRTPIPTNWHCAKNVALCTMTFWLTLWNMALHLNARNASKSSTIAKDSMPTWKCIKMQLSALGSLAVAWLLPAPCWSHTTVATKVSTNVRFVVKPFGISRCSRLIFVLINPFLVHRIQSPSWITRSLLQLTRTLNGPLQVFCNGEERVPSSRIMS